MPVIACENGERDKIDRPFALETIPVRSGTKKHREGQRVRRG